MQEICIFSGCNSQVLQDLELNALNMSCVCQPCMIAMDEMSIQESRIDNVEWYKVEG